MYHMYLIDIFSIEQFLISSFYQNVLLKMNFRKVQDLHLLIWPACFKAFCFVCLFTSVALVSVFVNSIRKLENQMNVKLGM